MTAKEELAQRAVRSKHWRWMPGMRVIHFENFPGNTARIHTVTTDGFWAKDYDVGTDDHWDAEDRATPDLDDPATLGCLEILTLEAHGPEAATFEVRGNPSPDMEGLTRHRHRYRRRHG